MAAFVTDSFTDTNGVTLVAHTGELGAAWVKHATAGSTGHPQITPSIPASTFVFES